VEIYDERDKDEDTGISEATDHNQGLAGEKAV
jgi:hypothetical protein